MIFGIHSLLFKETFVEKDLPVLDKCKKMGFDAVEIIPFDVDHFPAAKVKQAAKDLGLTINIGFGLPEEFNTISPDPAVRKKGVELSKRLTERLDLMRAKLKFNGKLNLPVHKCPD